MIIWVCLIAIGLFGLMWILEAMRESRERNLRHARWRKRFLKDDNDGANDSGTGS